MLAMSMVQVINFVKTVFYKGPVRREDNNVSTITQDQSNTQEMLATVTAIPVTYGN
jgi:hypothetical protein